MSQRLTIRTKKDGSAKGAAIRKTDSVKDSNALKALFQIAYNEHLKRKNNNAKSES
jgi:hypothetical protein